jgi:hypothetical protein
MITRTIMNLKTFFCLSLLCILAGTSTAAPANGTPFDLQGFIDRELQAGKTRVIVPPGRYRVTPRNRQHLVLRGLRDVQIIADGVEMICTETTRALTVQSCTNVLVRGLVIDYDPLPFTQGRITSLSADKKVHEIELFEGYPPAEAARNFKYEIFRPDTRTLRTQDHYPQKVEAIDHRHLRVSNSSGSANDPEQVGDLIVIGTEYAPQGSIPHAVECNGNVNVRLESIDLFASNCFGFLENNCDGSTYLRCRIDRRTAATDPVRRADARLRSLDADAYHSKHAIKGPAYLECTARFMGDDCVNICGDYHLITASQGTELRVLAKHTLNLQPGDEVELVTYDGRRLPDARVVSLKPAGNVLDEERAFISKQRMDAGLRSGKGALTKAWTVTLNRAVEIPLGGVICSANRIGNGFAVKGCTFGYNRSRGILIKASRGEVSNNRIEGCEMSGILVAPEYWWLEAGSSSDLVITGNQITACKGIPILVEAIAGQGGIAPAGAHQNLTITGNTVRDCPAPGIVVTSTTGLRLENNHLLLTGTRKELPGILRQAGLKEAKPEVQINCLP